MRHLIEKALAGPVVREVTIPGLTLFSRGKVRDTFIIPSHPDKLLVVTTDRISAFDVVLPAAIPAKGKVLSQMTIHWLEYLSSKLIGMRHHLITTDFDSYVPAFERDRLRPLLTGRTMVVRKLTMVPVEIVWRKYISGSLWKEYREALNDKGGVSVCIRDLELPSDLMESSKLPVKVFTPATKAQEGHDANISFEAMIEQVDRWASAQGFCGDQHFCELLRDLSSKIYSEAFTSAWHKDIIIADTKFEFGIAADGGPVLADEVLTPDSSRFWDKGRYKEGQAQDSYDKQYVRDYLLSIKWDKTPPAPDLPSSVITNTLEKYVRAFQLITGRDPVL